MPELVIAGPDASQRRRLTLPEGETIRLGRAPQSGFAVPWDQMISREHADLRLGHGEVLVQCLEKARNPVYYLGEPVREFTMSVGEMFRIGSTSFRLVEGDITTDAPENYEELAYRQDELKAFKFRNAEHWLDVLSNLPNVISQSHNDEAFASRLVEVLLDAVPRADAAAVVFYDTESMSHAPLHSAAPAMMRWDSRRTDISGFRPSRRLILSSLERDESLLHIWNADESSEKFTYSGRFDWAFCVPFRREAGGSWCLYVSGNLEEQASLPQILSGDELKEELRFIELLAEFTGAVRQVRVLEQQSAGMRQFFSPNIRETVTSVGAESLLAPKETEITVLFCDVRGFSKEAEQHQHNLHTLLARVSKALGIMSKAIFNYDGVIADFQGDAALGFWGWPVSASDGPLPACRAALAIHKMFSAMNTPNQPQTEGGFQVGIGIAYGKAIAGKIGTDEQAKVGVFGPVVNLGSRLESMTKRLRASILLDEPTAEYVRQNLPPAEGRCRRLGLFRPYGMESTLVVSELLPPVEQAPDISDDNLIQFEQAVDAFTGGRWQEALSLLDQLPTADRTKDFIRATIIGSSDYQPPPNWDGVFKMSEK